MTERFSPYPLNLLLNMDSRSECKDFQCIPLMIGYRCSVVSCWCESIYPNSDDCVCIHRIVEVDRYLEYISRDQGGSRRDPVLVSLDLILEYALSNSCRIYDPASKINLNVISLNK